MIIIIKKSFDDIEKLFMFDGKNFEHHRQNKTSKFVFKRKHKFACLRN